ncbi:MAG: VOC family protein [Stappiaceae bacterium]
MFDHLEFSVTCIDAARRFYGPIAVAIGAGEVFFDEAGHSAGFGPGDRVQLLLSQGARTEPAMHICFTAPDKISVEKAYADAISGGGTCNGKPGYRDHYAAGYFAAFVIDPDGHNVEILFREHS